MRHSLQSVLVLFFGVLFLVFPDVLASTVSGTTPAATAVGVPRKYRPRTRRPPATSSSSNSGETAATATGTDEELDGQRLSSSDSSSSNSINSSSSSGSDNIISDDSISNSNIIEFSHKTKFIAECTMPTDVGDFRMRSYQYYSSKQHLEPIVMYSDGGSGTPVGSEDVMVRVHDQCLTSEVFGSYRCDCKDQLKESLRVINEKGGLVIYLQQEGRGIGIANKVAAYSLQDEGMDTVDANTHLGFDEELREYQSVPDILADLGIKSIRLVTNNPYKVKTLLRAYARCRFNIPLFNLLVSACLRHLLSLSALC
jgi:GTP cyclohydrolase II